MDVKRQLTIICFLMAGMLAGCSSAENLNESIVDTETAEMTQEFFKFEDETGDGQMPLVDYNETNLMKIDALRIPWGEPLPYFHITEKMETDFFRYMNVYRSQEFPGVTGIQGIVGMGPSPNEEQDYELSIGTIDADTPLRQYVMVIVESGCVELSFEDKMTGEVLWESDVLTESEQFFKEFESLHVENSVLYIHEEQLDGEPIQVGVWHALFPHRTFIEENWEGFIDPYESTAADQQ